MSSRSLWRTPRTRALLLVGTLSLISGIATLAARVYTDAAWFGEVQQPAVYWSGLAWRVLPLAFAGLGTACFVLVNLKRATAHRPARLAAALATGLIVHKPHWEQLALWAHRTDFGATDPIFHRDAGFYVFTLPLYEQTARWLLETIVIAAALTAAAYGLERNLKRAKRHLIVLAALGLLVTAWRLRLDQFALVLPHGHAVVPGATHTDVHIRLPLLRAARLLTLAGAAFAAYAAIRRINPAKLLVPGLTIAVVAGAAGGLPDLIETLDVSPQALARERPYVEAAIAATRRAYALDALTTRQLDTPGTLTGQAIDDNDQAIANVPLWDSGVLRPALNETRAQGGYYSFGSITVDRHDDRLLTLAARRLDLKHVEHDSWANTHFAYTHGYGVTAVRGGETDDDRYPKLEQTPLTQPRIYFGERAPHDPPFVILNSRRAEVEQPSPDKPSYRYDGRGGIPIGSALKKAAFAIRFQDLDLFLTETITSASRIAIHRDALERVQTLAPFLDWDTKPQTVVTDGRVEFLFHGYTSSDHYPYSEPVNGVNYLRAPALAVVDAFDGKTTLYATDTKDPILTAWRKTFPSLFKTELRTNLQPLYPKRLFNAQARILETYHADRRHRPLERRRRLEPRPRARRPGRGGGPPPVPGGQPGGARPPELPAHPPARRPRPKGPPDRHLHAQGPREPRRLPRRLRNRTHAAHAPARAPGDRAHAGHPADPRQPRRRRHVAVAQPRIHRPRPRIRQPRRARDPEARPHRRRARPRPARLHHNGGDGLSAAAAGDRARERPRRLRRDPARRTRASTARRSAISTSIATAQNASANSTRVSTVGTSSCPAKSTSMIDESPRLSRSEINAATAYKATPTVRNSSIRSRPASGRSPTPAPTR